MAAAEWFSVRRSPATVATETIGYDTVLETDPAAVRELAIDHDQTREDLASAAAAASFLRERGAEDDPFFLSVGLYDTHRPLPLEQSVVDPDRVQPPPELPDRPAVRAEWAAFLALVEFDAQLGQDAVALGADGADVAVLDAAYATQGLADRVAGLAAGVDAAAGQLASGGPVIGPVEKNPIMREPVLIYDKQPSRANTGEEIYVDDTVPVGTRMNFFIRVDPSATSWTPDRNNRPAAGETWDHYAASYAEMGGIVEAWIEGEMRSRCLTPSSSRATTRSSGTSSSRTCAASTPTGTGTTR